jgi:hypothetical protein
MTVLAAADQRVSCARTGAGAAQGVVAKQRTNEPVLLLVAAVHRCSFNQVHWPPKQVLIIMSARNPDSITNQIH